MRTILVIALLIGSAAFAETKGERLSWYPRDYLKRGYRSAPWVRDPFFPEEGELVLSGVISSEMAYVNGRWVRRGEKLGEFVVTHIHPEGVTLTRGGETIVLKLKE